MMSLEFYAEPHPSAELISRVAALAPVNPFYSLPYVKCRQDSGSATWVLMLRGDSRIVSACTAFLRSGRLNKSLEIHSLPVLPAGDAFWTGLLQFCTEQRISSLEVNSAASAQAEIPVLPGEIWRKRRNEHVIFLDGADLWKNLRKDHITNIRRAHRAGLKLHRSRDTEACIEHCKVISASIERRRARGESIAEDTDPSRYMLFLENGAGLLFQAVAGGKVMSSDLILLAAKGGYGHSIGTNAEGMRCGASHFLEYEIAAALQAEGMEVFNLGGTDQSNPGLENFKAGFGAGRIELESAQFYLGTKLQSTLTAALAMLRKVGSLRFGSREFAAHHGKRGSRRR
jgi:hypothetical protein